MSYFETMMAATVNVHRLRRLTLNLRSSFIHLHLLLLQTIPFPQAMLFPQTKEDATIFSPFSAFFHRPSS
ncbi:unnamed protein product [Brassica oleracea var. botrytis]|uniref:Uncharacterized protein n=2 Tax=Brassica TaxID=3705 RepID=A0A0D3CRW9_BRAOL